MKQVWPRKHVQNLPILEIKILLWLGHRSGIGPLGLDRRPVDLKRDEERRAYFEKHNRNIATPEDLEDWRRSHWGRVRVPWKSKLFLGRRPKDRTESNRISAAVRRLEKKKLIHRVFGGKVRSRTTHLRLSDLGAIYVLYYWWSFNQNPPDLGITISDAAPSPGIILGLGLIEVADNRGTSKRVFSWPIQPKKKPAR